MSDFSSTDRSPLTTILKEKSLWSFVAVTVLYFYRPLFLKETFFFRDLHLIFYPQRLRLLKLLSAGELPLWDPYLHGGQPFLAEVNNAALSPFLWLYWVLPVPLAFNAEIVVHVLLAGAGAYLLARVLGFRTASSFIAAASYSFCGYTLSFINLSHRFLAVPYLPFLLAFWHLWLAESKKRWLVAAAVSATLQLFTGAFEMSLISFLILLLWSFLFPYPAAVTVSKKIMRWLALVVLTAGLGCVQIVPTAEMVSGSGRGGGYEYVVFGAWSLTPKRIPEMFVPRFMGYTNRLSLQDYWGAAIEGFHLPYVLSIYIGLPVLILVVASSFKSDGVLPLRARRLLLVSVVASTAVSMGRFLPFFHALYENVPVLHQFRYPIKLLGFTTIPLALLAAAGSHSLFGNETVTDRSSRGRIALWLIFALVAAFTAAFSLSHEFSSSFLAGYFGSDNLKAPAPLLESFLHASAVFLLSILVLQYRHVQRRNIQHMLFAVVVLLDLLIAGKTVNHYAPQQFLTATPQLAHQVRKRIDDGRYWRDQNPQNIVFNIPFNDALYLDHWNLETLYNYSGVFYDIKVVFHEDYDGLANKQIQDLRSFVLTAPWDRRLPMLSAAGVKLILSAENRTIPGLRKLGVVRNNSNTLFY
ncbi:MAG TPA: hypothetical protein VI958_10210, partial [Acidobacteriota bacterium]